MKIKRELIELRNKNGIVKIKPCSAEEQKKFNDSDFSVRNIPENIFFAESVGYYDVTQQEEISAEDEMKLVAHKQLESINNIKKHVRFFYVMGVISLVLGVIVGFISVLATCF